jgi:hypothetical protein
VNAKGAGDRWEEANRDLAHLPLGLPADLWNFTQGRCVLTAEGRKLTEMSSARLSDRQVELSSGLQETSKLENGSLRLR